MPTSAHWNLGQGPFAAGGAWGEGRAQEQLGELRVSVGEELVRAWEWLWLCGRRSSERRLVRLLLFLLCGLVGGRRRGKEWRGPPPRGGTWGAADVVEEGWEGKRGRKERITWVPPISVSGSVV
jgi:hypothetical protein